MDPFHFKGCSEECLNFSEIVNIKVLYKLQSTEHTHLIQHKHLLGTSHCWRHKEEE